MSDTTTEIIKLIAQPTVALLSAWLGYKFALRGREYDRRRKSVHDAADIFASEAGKWCDVSFQVDERFKDWHRASIYRLSGHVEYLKRHHRKKWDEIDAKWVFYSGAGKPISSATYLEGKREDYIESLYQIADALRNG